MKKCSINKGKKRLEEVMIHSQIQLIPFLTELNRSDRKFQIFFYFLSFFILRKWLQR